MFVRLAVALMKAPSGTVHFLAHPAPCMEGNTSQWLVPFRSNVGMEKGRLAQTPDVARKGSVVADHSSEGGLKYSQVL